MTVNCWFLSPEAVLAATFIAQIQEVLEIHDHRGCVMSIHGDEEIWLNGYSISINDSFRQAAGENGKSGQELREEGFLKGFDD